MGALPLLTSLAPARHDIQQAAVQSWIGCGFSPVSLNEPAEAESLAPAYPDVSFAPVDETYIDRSTRAPLVRIDAFLQHCRRLETGPFAIANADVLLDVHLPSLSAILTAEDAPSMCISHRVDTTSTREREGETYGVGFDFFCCNREAVDAIPPSPFCIGLPMWDYWLPLALLRQSGSVHLLDPPVAFHPVHDIQWDWDRYIKMAEHLFKLLGAQQRHLDNQSLFDFESRRQSCYIGSDMALQWILAHAHPRPVRALPEDA